MKPFQPNGCTSAPDLFWKSCCDAHDEAYFNKQVSRAEADKAFLSCLRRDAKTPLGKWIIAPAYYLAVRLFGASYWNTSG